MINGGGFWLNFENIYDYLSGEWAVLYLYADTVGVDVTRAYTFLFWHVDCLCYGCDYTRWLLGEFRGYVVKRTLSNMRRGCFVDSFALNWDFVTSMCSPEDLELLRLHLPVLFS